MPLRHCLAQDIQNTAADTVIGVRVNTDFGSDFIRNLKTHALNIFRHFVRIFLQHAVQIITIGIINFDR